MVDPKWEVVDEVEGELQASIIQGLLEAQGIESTLLSQESLGKTLGLSIARLGKVQILVPSDVINDAKEILEAYYQGDFDIGEEEI
ncbi:MAG: hypothetical protein FVQ83_07330 [Chloroflexi bacterium]|nr:hypothetical protein [Chloroflexota bacterium]